MKSFALGLAIALSTAGVHAETSFIEEDSVALDEIPVTVTQSPSPSVDADVLRALQESSRNYDTGFDPSEASQAIEAAKKQILEDRENDE